MISINLHFLLNPAGLGDLHSKLDQIGSNRNASICIYIYIMFIHIIYTYTSLKSDEVQVHTSQTTKSPNHDPNKSPPMTQMMTKTQAAWCGTPWWFLLGFFFGVGGWWGGNGFY